jgi:2-aminoadipate transaminase
MSGLASIRLAYKAPTPLYRQIADQITQAVHEGLIPPGERLPPVRQLAGLLAVSPITVSQAYQTLAQEGVATGQIGRGTFILPMPAGLQGASASQSPVPSAPEPGGFAVISSSSFVHPTGTPVVPASDESTTAAEDWMSPLAAVPRSSRRGQRRSVALGQLFTHLLRNDNDPSLIDFSGANPAPELFGLAGWQKILAQAGRSLEQETRNAQDRSAFQYGPSMGDPALRVFLTTYLQRYSLAVTADEILLTSGTQQGLDLVARTLFAPGDSVFVEEHSYIAALDIFEQFDVQLRPIPMDEEGLQVEELERLLGAPQARPRWLYTIPTGQSPTGISLAVERRRLVAEAAHHAHVIIVEDDAFNDLSYEPRAERASPLPAVSSFAHRERFIYLKSFSKTTFPGVRLGCLVAAPALLSILAEEKGLVDRGASVLVARAVLAYLRLSSYTRHLQDMRAFYIHRRDVLLAALERTLRHLGCSWTIPGAGFSLLLTIPAELDENEVLEEAVANGIVVAPGRFFSAAAPLVPDHTLRLTFGDKSPEQLEEATRRLELSLRTVLDRRGAATAAAYPAAARRMTTDV